MADGTMQSTVPVVKDIREVYYPEDLPRETERFSRFLQHFSKIYSGARPAFVARSPGRVNIIGEHVDHQLYEVLPMAIAADVLIAVSPRSKEDQEPRKISIANLNEGKFKAADFSFMGNGDVDIDSSVLEWTNYFKAGFRGAVGLLRKHDPHLTPCGMDVLVDGSVPPGAGVSSSAAFVCASALAVLRANGQSDVIKADLTELAIVSERAVGVNSGGMDQAASVFPLQGEAISVGFYPELRAEAIKFPDTNPPITFMIAQSFVTANKHETAPIHYNLRVVECTLASEWLAAKNGVKLAPDAGASGKSLHGFEVAYYDSVSEDAKPQDPKQRLLEMLEMTKVEFSAGNYTREEISSAIGRSLPDLEKEYFTKFPVRADKFMLRQRAEHAFGEALRVLKFKDLLLSQQSSSPNDSSLLQQLGDLMSETQTSCRDLYQNSCPELDKMCEIAKEAGAYGSRLTGAGWGGCTVHLVPKDKVDTIKRAWEEKYYRVRDPSLTAERLEELGAVVVSQPGHGSMV